MRVVKVVYDEVELVEKIAQRFLAEVYQLLSSARDSVELLRFLGVRHDTETVAVLDEHDALATCIDPCRAAKCRACIDPTRIVRDILRNYQEPVRIRKLVYTRVQREMIEKLLERTGLKERVDVEKIMVIVSECGVVAAPAVVRNFLAAYLVLKRIISPYTADKLIASSPQGRRNWMMKLLRLCSFLMN